MLTCGFALLVEAISLWTSAPQHDEHENGVLLSQITMSFIDMFHWSTRRCRNTRRESSKSSKTSRRLEGSAGSSSHGLLPSLLCMRSLNCHNKLSISMLSVMRACMWNATQ